jgi:calcium-dependent protein kinase
MGCFPSRSKDKSANQYDPFQSQLTIQRCMIIQGYDIDPFHRYQKMDGFLGEGSYGKVYKVYDKINKTYRALKKIKKEIMTKNDEIKIKKEIEILKMLDHPNIIKILEFYNTQCTYYIVTELLSGGELYQKISNNKNLSEPNAVHVMKQVLHAVNYCHQKKIIHRDLKPENILIEDRDSDQKFNVKIIDFGTSEVFRDSVMLDKQIGTPYYIAPEVLDNKYNEKCDLWSCGVIFYILLSGSPPFKGKSESDIFKSVRSGKYGFKNKLWKTISSNAKDLISKLLEVNIDKRYSAEQALNHPLFNLTKSCDETDDTQPEITEGNQTDMSRILKNLEKYKAYKNLQKAILYFIIHNCIPKEQFKETRDLFVKFDSNFDGRLSKEEMFKGIKQCRYINITDNEMEILMRNVDIDKNGFIEYEEFLTATYNPAALLTEKNLTSAFGLFDKDGSGKISASELRQVLGLSTNYDNKIWKKIISEVDLNGDGEISYEEFKQMMFNVNNLL